MKHYALYKGAVMHRLQTYLRLILVLSTALISNFLYTLEKKIVVEIPSYNNREWYKYNLDSVFAQKYSNYRIIYTDDCSSDGTGDLVEQYIRLKKQAHRVTLIKNNTRRRSLANHYHAIHLCQDDEIIVNLDGDDWFAHEYVLAYINRIYDDPDVWLTYGQYINWPIQRIGYCAAIPDYYKINNKYREHKWVFGHLRTFRAALAKQIKLEDCLYFGKQKAFYGKFYPAAADLALMYPMLEMTGGRYRFIPDILYKRNVQTPLNNFKVFFGIQQECGRIIRAAPRYAPLSTLYAKREKKLTANLVIFSWNNPQKLAVFLSSVKKYFMALEQVIILYKTDPNPLYTSLAHAYPNYTFIQYAPHQFKKIVMQTLQKVPNGYSIITTPEYVLTAPIDASACIKALEKTFAYGFYLSFPYSYTKSIYPPYEIVEDDIYVWQFRQATGEWAHPHSLSMVLYRNSDIITALKRLSVTTDARFEQYWKALNAPPTKVGLFYAKARVQKQNT